MFNELSSMCLIAAFAPSKISVSYLVSPAECQLRSSPRPVSTFFASRVQTYPRRFIILHEDIIPDFHETSAVAVGVAGWAVFGVMHEIWSDEIFISVSGTWASLTSGTPPVFFFVRVNTRAVSAAAHLFRRYLRWHRCCVWQTAVSND